MSLIKQAVANLDEDRALYGIKKSLESGINPEKVMMEVKEGLQLIGKKFNSKSYSLIELEMADELFNQCVQTIKSFSGESDSTNIDDVIIRKSGLSKMHNQGRVD
jgi:methanogenic corrinoid protein MtbC1